MMEFIPARGITKKKSTKDELEAFFRNIDDNAEKKHQKEGGEEFTEDTPASKQLREEFMEFLAQVAFSQEFWWTKAEAEEGAAAEAADGG